ncbi:uncharacterized protein LOC101846607 [Aplysia californica]|uniref:Uncharacterized protein LOC101846607 n=1 Tax=Aplysia californica TaxID=6500 RepID=A0ABM1AAF6_APLCA|nr:uncharacterized protein LOC101846607 [Aplysia californica]
MDQICDNIHYLQNNEECERQARADFEPCVARKVQYFQTQMIAMEGEMTHVPHSQRIEATMRLGCSFTQDITDCLRDPYSKYCPEHMTNLLLDVVQNFMPPACVGMGYEDKSYPYPQGDYDPDDDDEDYGDNRHDFTHTDIVIGSGKESPSGDADDDDDVRNSYEDRESNVKQPNPGYRVNKPSSGNEGVIGAARSEGKGDDDDENGQGRVVMDVPTFFVFITLCVLSISSLSWMC